MRCEHAEKIEAEKKKAASKRKTNPKKKGKGAKPLAEEFQGKLYADRDRGRDISIRSRLLTWGGQSTLLHQGGKVYLSEGAWHLGCSYENLELRQEEKGGF